MKTKDIYKIDNYLIKFGAIFLIIGLFTTFTDPRTYSDLAVMHEDHSFILEDYDGRTLAQVQKEAGVKAKIIELEKPVKRSIMAVSGLFLLIFGMVMRKKENKIISIWDALEKTTEAKVNNMAVSLGLTRDFILTNLKEINAQQGAYYVYSAEKDSIVDGKLMQEHSVSLQCPGCGNSVSKTASLAHLEDLSCSYCGAAIPAGELANVKSDMLKEIAQEQEEAQSRNKNSMSTPIFIALLIFFWPGAIAYYMYKKGSHFQYSAETIGKIQRLQQENANK